MIVFKDKTDCIKAYEELGRALDSEIIEDLDEVTRQLIVDDMDLRWVVLATVCRICSHEMTMLIPLVAGQDNLECANCENFTSQEKEDAEWWLEKVL